MTQDSHTRKTYQDTDLRHEKFWRGRYSKYVDGEDDDAIHSTDADVVDKTDESPSTEDVPDIVVADPADLSRSTGVDRAIGQGSMVSEEESQAVAGAHHLKRARGDSTGADEVSSDREVRRRFEV